MIPITITLTSPTTTTIPFALTTTQASSMAPLPMVRVITCLCLNVKGVGLIRTEETRQIRPLFEQHGNVAEVILLKDRSTGQQQGSCFVKFATTFEADKAIAALNNQHYFPGEQVPITVKYAGKPDRERERERERHGAPDNKVFVAMLNKEASREEIMEIFSPYGFVEDVYIILDEMKQSRGCGFVRFSHADMAATAIKALNGTYTMRGCDRPLAVRFAEPKKVRNGEGRNNKMFSGMPFGPHSHEPVVRTTTNLGESMLGHNRPNAPYLAQLFSLTTQPQAVSLVANQEPLQLSQMQNIKTSTQQFQGEVHDFPRQLHLIQPSKQTLEQQKLSQASGQSPLPTVSSSQEVAYNIPRAAVLANPQTPELPECDWSEHTCPDGHKYYYNCITRESLWDKPKEYGLFEEQLKERQQQAAVHKLQSSSLVLSKQQAAQTQESQSQAHVPP
ncbi:flowering time control protein FCA isoform X2 [Cannabis sativa]|uniref:flowering time control protein FCA isoform X2 n=1 Tax=Cannabis sativa TaxID=3483 RepID=UPI0029CA93DC|nr:flowering time control protein FCA isoform X2 [Cannabis sativa]